MPLSRRYTPEWAAMDGGYIGMSFENIVPPHVGLMQNYQDYDSNTADWTPRLEIWTNFAEPVFSGGWNTATHALGGTDWGIALSGLANPAHVHISGRRVWAFALGGVAGVDYQFRWVVYDTLRNRYTRTGLLLVGATS